MAFLKLMYLHLVVIKIFLNQWKMWLNTSVIHQSHRNIKFTTDFGHRCSPVYKLVVGGRSSYQKFKWNTCWCLHIITVIWSLFPQVPCHLCKIYNFWFNYITWYDIIRMMSCILTCNFKVFNEKKMLFQFLQT